MKIIFAVLCALSVSQAAVVVRVPGPDDPGISTQYQNQDDTGNYDFGYDESHLSGGSFRKETGDVFGNKIGSYGLRDADGRLRVVNYIADANGFRADIKTNEPGVAAQDPASVTISKVPGVLVPPFGIPPPAPVVVPSPLKGTVLSPPPPLLKGPIPGPPPPPLVFKQAVPPPMPYAVPPASGLFGKYPGNLNPYFGLMGAPYYGNVVDPRLYPPYGPAPLVPSYKAPVPYVYPKGPAYQAYKPITQAYKL